MRIFRIEHPGNGRGPYKQTTEDVVRDEYGTSINIAHSDCSHPNPRADFGHWIMSYEQCAFDSIEKLLVWFDEQWIDILHDAGYMLCEYEVPDLCVRVGNFQVVYDADKARLIHKERV